MSEIFSHILALIAANEVLISSHGYDELAEDGILAKDVLVNVTDAIVIEEYPTYYKGPCALVFQRDSGGEPIHVLWGIAKGTNSPAVVVTAYRPDPKRWSEDFLRRVS